MGDYPVIDIIHSVEQYKRVFCSDYFLSIELIPLETNDECLIDNWDFTSMAHIILLNDDFIFFNSKRNLYTFDYTGKFLHQIGEIGQGPRDFLRLYDFFLNKDEPTIFISDVHKVLEYDFHGNFIHSFPNPIVEDEIIFNNTYAGDKLFVGSINFKLFFL